LAKYIFDGGLTGKKWREHKSLNKVKDEGQRLKV
jgi:hypothetical protein